MKTRVSIASLALLLAMPAHAEPSSPRLQRAHKEKIAGMALSFAGLAISLTGGIFAIVNHGFPRDTSMERTYFGLSVGLAGAAAPIVTTGVVLWAQGAVIEQREKKRLSLAADGLRLTF